MSKANDFEHYEKDGKRYDRISTILDYFSPPDLVAWKLRVGRKEAGLVSRAALRIGTNVDDAIRAQVEGRAIPKLKSIEARNCWEAYEQWRTENGVLLDDLHTVPTVYNDQLMVAGTPDLKVGPYCLMDVKCSSSIRPGYWLQTEFYARSLGLEQKAILRLDKNLAIFEFRRKTLNDEHWAAVRGLVAAYRYYKPLTERKGDEDECSNGTTISTTNDAF